MKCTLTDLGVPAWEMPPAWCLQSGSLPAAHSHVRSCTCRYADTYGVRLDPSTQALSLIGSQEGLGHLLMAVADPGRCSYSVALLGPGLLVQYLHKGAGSTEQARHS